MIQRPALAIVLTGILALLPSAWVRAQDLVAPTEPLTPQEQLAKFHLPEGFQIQLVASEPAIGKPMNMAFDSAGRLWVTSSLEYPYAAKDPAKARDTITVYEGIGRDGRPARVRTFAQGLNIPIGVLPMNDGAMVWSIPALWRLRDTDGDGSADTKEILLDGFEYVDTHGNQNSFRRWLDGWIYAAHGYRNHSRIRLQGKGEVALELQSGNTYRFREDGSAIEQFTFGQVNPFGLTFDSWGNLFSADCHSMPVTCLLRGACYESFGKPHDGLGYAPSMIDHDHGSTGIGGIAWYAAEDFPKEYRECLYLGNPVTGKVHRDRLAWTGATPRVQTQPDFITCDDPWFRPVDIQMGPDGALYIADFYNCIIGHYEVPLTHPRRDRTRGRIWRVVSRDGHHTPMADLAKLPLLQLVGQLSDSNLALRTLATHALVDRRDPATVAMVQSFYQLHVPPEFNTAKRLGHAHGLWVLHRLGGLDRKVAEAAAKGDPLVRTHLMKALAETPAWEPFHWELVRAALDTKGPQESAFVVKAAAEALGRHPAIENVKPLLEAWARTPAQDTHLIHTIRIALRDHMNHEPVTKGLEGLALTPQERKGLVDVAMGAASGHAADFIFDYAKGQDVDRDLLVRALSRVAGQADGGRLAELADFARRRFAQDLSFQLTLMTAGREALARKGIEPPLVLKEWAMEVAGGIIGSGPDPDRGWTNFAIPGQADSANLWALQERPSADGKPALLLSSHPLGEHLTGILRSRTFTLPPTLSFFVAGHNGVPDQNPPPRNLVRLRLAQTGQVAAQALPPRNDTAQQITWELKDYAGREGFLEVVDGDTGNAYAWIAVGRFDPPVVTVPLVSPAQSAQSFIAGLRLASSMKLQDLAGEIAGLAGNSTIDWEVRAESAGALLTLERAIATDLLVKIIGDDGEPEPLRARAAGLLGALPNPAAVQALAAALAGAPQSLGRPIALAMASRAEGGQMLLDGVGAGKASARLLQEPAIVERLKAAKIPDLEMRLALLTKALPPADERVAQILAQRREGFAVATPDPQKGLALFTQFCAACHQVAGQGNRIGPNLDGIGQRGFERLLEDILDPNRNVDPALGLTIFKTKDDQAVAGTLLRQEGQVLVIADPAGKEIRLPMDQVAQTTATGLSLMPATFADGIPPDDLNHLLAYLLALRAQAQ